MKRTLLLAIAILGLASCKKEENTVPQYWEIINYHDTDFVVKHYSNRDTLTKNQKIVVFNKPTFECLSTVCIVSINGKMKNTDYLGEY